VDVSCDPKGSCGFAPPPTYTSVAIADPSVAPYGVAAQTVLTGRYDVGFPLPSYVHKYPNITAAFTAVIQGTDPIGFVAMSAICSAGIYPTAGTSALAYFAIESTTTMPPMLVNNYNPLTQAGIAVKSSRGSAQNTELQAFVDFLTDFTTSPSPDPPMITTLKKFCYSAP
jgi:ABC-type molybdate transport system substrate-binding protein